MAATKNFRHMVPGHLIGLLVLFLELRLRPPNPKLVHQISPVCHLLCFSILSHDPGLNSILCPPAPDCLERWFSGMGPQGAGDTADTHLMAWDPHTQEK